MPQYLSPGVYVEETPSTARPIAGVGTSTAGFIGVVADSVKMPEQPGKFTMPQTSATASATASVSDTTVAEKNKKKDKDADAAKTAESKPADTANTAAPVAAGTSSSAIASTTPVPVRYTVAKAGEPQLITSWGQFKNSFGDIQTGNLKLAHAVYGFFNNGGTRCWVTRVAADTDLTTAENLDNALARLGSIDEIAIVAVPGATAQAQHMSILMHCSNLKDRFAVLDGVTPAPSPLTADTIALYGRSAQGSYGAVYFPWITVPDPVSGGNINIPPSGHIAGIYARSDAARGVHKAPANEVVLGAVGLERLVSKAEQDGLNPQGVNVIRSFNGTITVWGARTRADEGNSDFKYISTRRLFIFLSESIDQGTRWVVFEPNTPALWQSITRNVTAFLTNVWRAGALFGDRPEQAFYVKCDADTNPPEQRDLGMVVTEIGVAIVRPAEFVIFRISQWSGPGN